jgi:hypothetical protein
MQTTAKFAFMKHILTVFASIVLFANVSKAQYNPNPSNIVTGEVGFSIGDAQYFGDLNTRADLSHPKITIGAMFAKQFGDYIGLKFSAHYAQLGYSDIYSKNVVQQDRNLSFNSNIFELALQGQFNFFRFIPGEPGYQFTPYVTIGIGAFSYNPYAYLAGEKYYLRPLNTEGQGLPGRPATYGTMAACFPIGIGFKYNLGGNTNVFVEVAHRFTTTDYLDDVSTTYAGSAAFPTLANGNPSPASLLQDRSYEKVATPIGIAGRQRGNSTQKDQYLFAEIGISFSLTSYRCPTAK